MDSVICVVFDLFMAAIMFLFGLWFCRSEGKGANLLSGYNIRPKEERKKYDEVEMCRAYGRRMMFMAVPFMAGALVDFFKAGAGCILAWGVWIILFIFLLRERSRRER